jgi:hypothetical protein
MHLSIQRSSRVIVRVSEWDIVMEKAKLVAPVHYDLSFEEPLRRKLAADASTNLGTANSGSVHTESETCSELDRNNHISWNELMTRLNKLSSCQ